MKAKLKLVMISIDYKSKSFRIVSDTEEELSLPVKEIIDKPIDTQVKDLFSEYCDLSFSFVNLVLADAKVVDGDIEIYYGVVFPPDTALKQGYVYTWVETSYTEIGRVINKVMEAI